MKAVNFKKFEKGVLKGFFDVELDNGMVLKGMSWMESDAGNWVNFPSKPFTDKEGNTKYQNQVVIPDKSKYDMFQKECKSQLAALAGESEGGGDPF